MKKCKNTILKTTFDQELAAQYGVRQAPTLVAAGGGEPVKAVGLGPVKQFIQASRPASAG